MGVYFLLAKYYSRIKKKKHKIDKTRCEVEMYAIFVRGQLIYGKLRCDLNGRWFQKIYRKVEYILNGGRPKKEHIGVMGGWVFLEVFGLC